MSWRAMTVADLPAVEAVAAAVHPGFSEGPEVFANRLSLAPATCLVLDGAGGIGGYLLAHPARLWQPPKLDTLVDTVGADSFYIHDLALLPSARGQGAAAKGVRLVLAEADRRFETAALVAVNDTAPFWARFGFAAVDDERLRVALASYGPGVRYMVRQRG